MTNLRKKLGGTGRIREERNGRSRKMNGMKYESRKETEEKQLVEVVVLKRRRTLEKNNRETRG